MIKHLYVHIPFCKSICSYCDFNKRVSSNKIMENYKNSLIDEISKNQDNLKEIETIFIGGGTPSYFPYLIEVLATIKKYIDLKKVKEYTIESTPSTISNLLPILKNSGINRVSIGVESLNKNTLKYINRPTNTYELLENGIVSLRKNGIYNINIDMIYGLPYETIDTIKIELDTILKLNPSHISYYELIIEDKTKLKYDLDRRKINLPSEDEVISIRDYIELKLKNSGYNKYEISNYSKTGYESLHNLAYWNNEEYLGVGAGAHSLIDNKRYYNTINPVSYINSIMKEYYERDEIKEYFLMGLRKVQGVSISEFKKTYKLDMFNLFPLIKERIDEGLLKIEGDYLKFTEYGMHIGNVVFEDFL